MAFLNGNANLAWAVGCGVTCSTSSDCTDSSCKWCHNSLSICWDCCEFTEQINCPESEGCIWESDECRNVTGNACVAGVPELPSSNVYLFVLLFVVAITIGVAGTFFYKKER